MIHERIQLGVHTGICVVMLGVWLLHLYVDRLHTSVSIVGVLRFKQKHREFGLLAHPHVVIFKLGAIRNIRGETWIVGD